LAQVRTELPVAARSLEGQAQLNAKVQQWRQQNITDQRAYETAVANWQNQQETQQRQTESAQRDVQRLKLQQQEAGAKRDRDTLDTADPGSREYAVAYQALAMPHVDPTTGATVYPIMTAYAKPTYKPPGATEVPDYSHPQVQLPTVMNQDQATAANYADRMRQADAIMKPLDTTAVSWGERLKQKAGDYLGYNINSPDNQRLRQAQENFISAILRKESGAAISQSEFDRYAGFYFPKPGDDAATIAQKQQSRADAIAGLSREAGPAYKPKEIAPEPPTKIIRFDKSGNRISE